MGCNHCEEFTRSHLVRQRRRRGGPRACRRSSRGMPAPGRDRAQPALLPAALERRDALRLRRLEAAARRAARRGSPSAAGGNDRVLVSIFLDGGIDSLSVLAPTTDPIYRSLRPTLALPAGAGTAFTEDPRLRWQPVGRRPSTPCTGAGKVAVLPAVGYTSPDQSHFTSRHYWEVGGLQPNEVTGWMGRLLDVIGTPDNPLQGLSLDGSLSPALATASMPVAAIDGPSYDLWAEGVWGEPEELMFGAVGELGRAGARAKDIGLQAAGAAAAQAMQLKAQLEPFSGEEITPPVAYPEGDGRVVRRRASPALAAMLAAGLPIRCAAISAPGRLRHPRQPGGELRRGPQAGRRHDRRLPGRPRGARARRPRAHPGLVGVRAPPGGERLGHRPRRRRVRLRDRQPGPRPDGRRVPRPRAARRRRQPARDLRLPRPLLLDHRAVVRRRRRRGDPRRRRVRARRR